MIEASQGVGAIALAWLEQAPGERRYVEGETRLGRGEGNNIRLSDRSVSRNHALIRRVEGGYLISDLGSANGTFVNGERVKAPLALSSGDQVRLASAEFTFHLEMADVPADVRADPRVAASVSQFLTMSGQLDPQSYADGDLRVVTVLFLDLHGFTALSATRSPDQVTVVMNQCFKHLTETVARFGGYVDKYIGDSMMVLFGAPHAHADDATRAVLAAVALQEVLTSFSERLRRRSGITLEMRIGINTGEVLAGRVGTGQFSAYTVMGDVVNVAKRLEQEARVGHVLVGDLAYQLTRHAVRYTALPPTRVRGRTEPLNVYEVETVLQERLPSETDTPFVGRGRERRRLSELLGAKTGLQSVSIVGPAGSGKSLLLARSHAEHANDACWIVVHCPDYDRERPYSTLKDLFEALTGKLDQSTQLDLNQSLDDAALRKWVPQIMRDLSHQGPLVIALDNAGCADTHSLELLEETAAELTDLPVMFVTTARDQPVGLGSGPTEVIQLEELTADECGEFIRALLPGQAIDPDAIAAVTVWGGGNPLTLADTVAAAVGDGQLQLVDGQLRLGAPLSPAHAFRLRTVVQSALDGLQPAQRQALRMASVIGEPWSASLLQGALESEVPAAESLLQLTDLGYLVQTAHDVEPTYDFRWEATRAVINAGLPALERRRLHDRVALTLQQQYDPGRPDPGGLRRIAAHFARAGQQWRAVEYLLRSGDIAAASLTSDAAVAEYRSVLQHGMLLSDPKERVRLEVEVQERIGDVLLRETNLAEAQIAFELASINSTSAQRRAELQIKLGLTAVRRGHPHRVIELADSVLAFPNITAGMRAHVEALAAVGLAAQGKTRAALERADHALQAATEVADAGALGLAYVARGRVYLYAGNLAEAVADFEHSGAARANAGDSAAWAESQLMLGLAQCSLGALRDADESIRAALATARAGVQLATANIQLAPDASADPMGSQEPADRWNLAYAALAHGRLLLSRGQVSRGRQHLRRALRTAERAGARELAQEIKLELASSSFAAGNPASRSSASVKALDTVIDDARSVLETARALDLACLACSARTVLSMALVERANAPTALSTDAREAFDMSREALVLADRLGLRLQGALARRAVGLALLQLGFVSHGSAQFNEVVAELERIGARTELVRTLVLAARAEYMHSRDLDKTGLRAKLARAVELADALGLEGDRLAAMRLQGVLAQRSGAEPTGGA